MKRKSVDECQELYVQALRVQNWNDVVVWATELLKYDQAQPGVWGNRGIGLQRLGHPLDAILNHQRALKYDETVNHYTNIGSSYQDMDQYDTALTFFEKALKLDNTIPQIHMNIGHVYKWRKQYDKALDSYYQATQVGPDYVDGHLAYGMCLLKRGQLELGWKEFEWRWKSDQLPPRGLKFEEWAGSNLDNKSILVYGEQGLGDIIQFARYARILAEKYPRAKIIIEGKQPVRRLLETIPGVSVINYGEKIPPVDYMVAMITLAGMFTPTIESIPTKVKEFTLRQDDVETWKNRFDEIPAPHNKQLRVGVCWAGMARMNSPMALKIDEVRSIFLNDFAGLADIPGIVWISLQKGPPAEQVKKPPAKMTIVDFTEDMYDFYETCCAIENCDLVISVDTAVAHASASIGKTTWMLSRWDGCWRWFGDREDSPWYPTLRQFVQPAPHDWDGVIQKLEVELKKWAKDKNAPELNLTLAK